MAKFCYLHQTPLQELFNLRWYIQHLINENEDEFENCLSEENWMKQANRRFISTLYTITFNDSQTTGKETF